MTKEMTYCVENITGNVIPEIDQIINNLENKMKINKDISIGGKNMSRIRKVNYGEMAIQAKRIREDGKQLNEQIVKAYTYLSDMHEFWYGKRYNKLVMAFNNMVPQLNEMLSLVVYKLPYSLELISNNYSMVDRKQKETAEIDEEPNRIKEIEITNDPGLRFLSDQVISIQQKISKCFEIAKDQMNEIEIEYKRILWESESADIFEEKFSEIKEKITAFFANINTEFKDLMQQTEDDLEKAEKINNVG